MSEPLEFPEDGELEAALKRLLLEANRPEALNLPEELEPVSPEFEARMALFLQDPFRAARRRRRRTLWRRALTSAACFLLVLSLSLAGVLCLSPTARAWTMRILNMWITEEGGGTSFIFTGREGEDTTAHVWRPTYLPEGFVETEVKNAALYFRVEFYNEEGERLIFMYQPVKEGYMFDMDNEHSDYSELELNGRTAHLFDSNTEGKPSALIWFSESGGVGFELLGEFSGKELIKIAESVEIVS